jgi:short-subunit dehydrogenase
MGVYCVSKHAVVTLTECLHQDLAARGAKIKASVLCPAFVPTGIADSGRNRPAGLREEDRVKSAEYVKGEEAGRHAVASGRISAAQVADMVLAAIREERFYILTHRKILASVKQRLDDILHERAPMNPLTVPPGDA